MIKLAINSVFQCFSNLKNMFLVLWEITFFRVLLALLTFVFIGMPLVGFLALLPLYLCEVTSSYWFLLIYFIYVAFVLSR